MRSTFGHPRSMPGSAAPKAAILESARSSVLVSAMRAIAPDARRPSGDAVARRHASARSSPYTMDSSNAPASRNASAFTAQAAVTNRRHGRTSPWCADSGTPRRARRRYSPYGSGAKSDATSRATVATAPVDIASVKQTDRSGSGDTSASRKTSTPHVAWAAPVLRAAARPRFRHVRYDPSARLMRDELAEQARGAIGRTVVDPQPLVNPQKGKARTARTCEARGRR